jgi:hypothetical protein
MLAEFDGEQMDFCLRLVAVNLSGPVRVSLRAPCRLLDRSEAILSVLLDLAPLNNRTISQLGFQAPSLRVRRLPDRWLWSSLASLAFRPRELRRALSSVRRQPLPHAGTACSLRWSHRIDRCERDARVIVDGQVHRVPADALIAVEHAIARDAMTSSTRRGSGQSPNT